MKITFDSNTWRKVATPDKFPKDPVNSDYRVIRNAINDGRIIPFISETVFTLEAIKKKDRKDFFRDYKADTKTKINENSDGSIHIRIEVGPNTNAHPGNNEFLNEHFNDAKKLGFNIIHLPRIAGISNKDIESARYRIEDQDLKEYLDKVFEVGARITDLQAGDFEIQQIGLKYDKESGFQGIGLAPDSENDNIAKAIAEWADGDSVASHIAIGGDFFCTNDKAKAAGIKSVFSESNKQILESEYGFKTISPTQLSQLLTT